MKERAKRNRNFLWSPWERSQITFVTKDMSSYLLFTTSQPIVKLV